MKRLSLILLILLQPLNAKATTEQIPGSFDWPIIGLELGLGGIIGFAIGYFFKKSLKILFFTLGFITLILVLLSQFEFINIQWDLIETTYSSAIEGTGGSKEILESISSWLKDRIPLGGGLIVGFFAGLKIG